MLLNRSKEVSIFFIVVLSVLVNIYRNGNIVYAEENEQYPIKDLMYPIYEYTNKIGQANNTQTIDIGSSAPKWNITKFELNFTDISLGKEIKDFEVVDTGFKVIEKFGKNYGYGVEINISENTTIYGVYIYGFKNALANTLINVQINGYDSALNAPNNTIYGIPISFNITEHLGWHCQKFSKPIDLPVGKYFLVLKSSESLTAKDIYYWGYNAYGQYSNLNVSEYNGVTWSYGVTNSTLLYKLIQTTDQIYNPQDINMTIEIDRTYYKIINGKYNGTGYVKITNLNYSPMTNTLEIPIKSNNSVTLNFSYIYTLGLRNKFDSKGSVILELDRKNKWKIEPIITRTENNYSVKIFYPVNWNDIEVYRNGMLVNSELYVIINTNEKFINLKSESILIGATWLISAVSTQQKLDIKFPEIEFEPNQELKFSIKLPQVQGRVIWKFIDTLGFEDFSETKEVISKEMSFYYKIPENPHEGSCKVLVIWYNNQEAGIDSQEIKINVPFTIDPQIILFVIIIIGIISTVSVASYMTIKKVRNKIEQNRKKLINKCMDVFNLNSFMVIEKNSGLCVYEEKFVGKMIDPALVSGFLDAIRSFGIELTGSYQHSQTIKLEYKDSKILMAEFKNFRLIIIMKESPSDEFLKSISALSYEIDEKYGNQLLNFNLNVTQFRGIKQLVEKHLNTIFLAPLKVVENENIKLNLAEKNEIKNAVDFMKENMLDYFFTSFLLPQHEFDPNKLKTLFNLIYKNIFQKYDMSKEKIKQVNNESNKKFQKA